MLVTSPAEAHALFERARAEDLLIQGVHHQDKDGRKCCDIIGILGDELQSPSDCPEQIMPLWLAYAASRLFGAQKLDNAKAWGIAILHGAETAEWQSAVFRRLRLARHCD